MNNQNFLFNFRFVLIGSLFICFGCQTKADNEKNRETTEEQVIETKEFYTIPFAEIIKNKRDVNLSEFASEVEIIQFDNTPKALLGRVAQVQVTDQYVFVKHSGNKLITQFSREGKYIRHIGTLGRGPKEYGLCRIFSIDEKNEHIYIQTNWTGKIMVYNFDGEYIKTIKYPAVERSRNVWSRDSFFVSFGEPRWGNEPFVFMEHNEKGDTIQTTLNNIFWNKSECSHSLPYIYGLNSFYYFGNKLHMKGWYNDTVYTYDQTNKIIPKFSIDLKNHKIPDDLIYQHKSTRPMPSEACWVGVHETQNYIFIPYGSHYNIQTRELLKEEKGCVVYNKRTKDGAMTKETLIGGFVNDITGGPDFRPTATNDTLAISTISALEMKLYLESDAFRNKEVKFPKEKEKLVQLKKTLNENDNHFFVLTKLK